MGNSTYSRSDYDARSTLRSASASAKGIPIAAATFAFDHDIKTGKTAAKVHDSLNPYKVNRESRDSVEHPVTVPIEILLDVTGSMAGVPIIIQEKLSHLMGAFLDDKASGKHYLGDGYPAILIGAVDDYDAMPGGDGCLQISQFESGIEVDNNLTNLWLTRQGGGTYSESYQLGLYFTARHTKHDHWDKRGRKGYCFIIGDEHAYNTINKNEVAKIIGDDLEADIELTKIIDEVQERYHCFFILPNMTSHYGDDNLVKYWEKLLGQGHCIRLEDPSKICECLVGVVAMLEGEANINDLATDLGIDGSLSKALVPLTASAAVGRYSAEGLPVLAGSVGGSERL